jgi:hypothetical protein
MKLSLASIGIIGSIALVACGGSDGTLAETDPMSDDTDGDTQSSDDDQGDIADDRDVNDVDIDEDEIAMNDEDVPSDDVEDESDTEAPSIETALPVDGASGVFDTDVIVIQFTEAMDQESVEDAYSSDTLPAENVTFSWNEAGTELTVTPNAPLAYAIGLDPEVLEPNSYAYSLSTDAQDLAGNALEEEHAVSFDTARMFLAEGPLVEDGYGVVDMDTGNQAGILIAGNSDVGHVLRGFLTFTLPVLPEERLALLVALETSQIEVTGDPYTKLADEAGALALTPAVFSNYEEVAEVDTSAPMTYVSQAAALGSRSVFVTEAIEPLYEGEATYAQFVFEFAESDDGDAEQDTALFDHNSTRLVIAYLLN